jgi:hypothetical protein
LNKRGTVKEQPLQSSPFVVEFEYGANAEGYWTYDHMVLQFEDCVDVVKVLYPEYDYMFLFYHSCGHDRKRPDGLCVNSMRKGFGGKETGHERFENGVGRFSRTILRTFEFRRKSKNAFCAKRCRTLLDDRGREAFK